MATAAANSFLAQMAGVGSISSSCSNGGGRSGSTLQHLESTMTSRGDSGRLCLLPAACPSLSPSASAPTRSAITSAPSSHRLLQRFISHPIPSSLSLGLRTPQHRGGILPSPRSIHASATAAAAAAVVSSELLTSDPYVAELLASLASTPAAAEPRGAESAQQLFDSLRAESAAAARSLRWPSRKDEAFRFTDISPLRSLALAPANSGSRKAAEVELARFSLETADSTRLVVVDGRVRLELSDLSGVAEGCVVGLLQDLPEETVRRFAAGNLGRLSGGVDLFSSLNGAATEEVVVIAVPADMSMRRPIHIVYATSAAAREGAAAVVSPRVLLVAEDGAEVEFVQEYADSSSEAGGSYWTNAVTEVVVGKGARVQHGVVQQQDRSAFFFSTTVISQAEGSSYSIVDAQLGSRVSRHTLVMHQLGAETESNVSTFCLAGQRQVHDLHSSLVLDHPRGVTRQLHKCIVTDSSGQAVFDGNVKVNKYAQQTDAGQLTRSLLLAPRGTVNVKPNLQIIADDVKCTHGAAISDLEEEQLFYFQARGINEQTARSALVFSFAAEVIEKFPQTCLRKRVEAALKAALASQGAMDSSVAAGLQ